MARSISLDTSVFHVQVKHILPNAVTVLSLCAGMTALILAADGRFALAISCVLLAAILDACDGRIARATGGTSKFGAELDSLADVVCFGAVPGFLVYTAFLQPYSYLGWAVCVIFLAASALRLARFNVMSTDADKPSWSTHFFSGIPAPAGAYLVLVPFYMLESGAVSTDTASKAAIFIMPLIALLMVSTVPTFSSKSMSRRALRLFFIPTLVAAISAIGFFAISPWNTLVLAAAVYLLSLPLSVWRHSIYVSRSA
jgi:CDP-diacylglycerol---serine O-phosphatidyltransferase